MVGFSRVWFGWFASWAACLGAADEALIDLRQSQGKRQVPTVCLILQYVCKSLTTDDFENLVYHNQPVKCLGCI